MTALVCILVGLSEIAPCQCLWPIPFKVYLSRFPRPSISVLLVSSLPSFSKQFSEMYTPVSTDSTSLAGPASILPKSAAGSSIEVTPGTTPSEGSSWHPGVAKHFPWLGFLALITTLLCCGSFVGILVASDGIPVDSWTLSPSVCLSIVSAVAVATLAFAYSEGVVISWWRKTLKGGTAGDLHRNWIYGQSAFEAFIAGRKFNLVAAASLMTVVAFISGP